MTTQQPERIAAMVAVSAPPYFPAKARTSQRAFSFESLPKREQEMMRQRSEGDDSKSRGLSSKATIWPKLTTHVNFTLTLLQTIQARTLIVFGDSDPLYRVKLAFELREAFHIPIWVIPGSRHGPIFAEAAIAYLRAA
jgi:pimeloyl-ACP methyl ester carboxylesterase